MTTNKHIIKFSLIWIVTQAVLAFLVGMLSGILGGMFQDFGINMPYVFILLDIVSVLIVFPAIAVAAKATYKNKQMSKSDIKGLAITLSLATLILMSYRMITSSVNIISIIVIVFYVAAVYFATSKYIKKYSIPATE